jgi:MarR family transcriptional regulator, organic hydroperoxide resistance regulator
LAEECLFIGTLGYLLMQVTKAHHDRARELLSPLGLYNGQEQILLHLQQQDGQSQTALAEKLCIQPATLTKSLNRMERSGLSQRLPHPVDHRITLVHITEHGQELCSSINYVWQNLDAETFNILTDEEQDILRSLLERVRANLQDIKFERNS